MDTDGSEPDGSAIHSLRRLRGFELKVPNSLAPWGEGKGEGKACAGSALQYDASRRVFFRSIAADEVRSGGQGPQVERE